jgi:hypothetical protein
MASVSGKKCNHKAPYSTKDAEVGTIRKCECGKGTFILTLSGAFLSKKWVKIS